MVEWEWQHDCQDHIEWVEQEDIDGNGDVFINSFWACAVCGEGRPYL